MARAWWAVLLLVAACRSSPPPPAKLPPPIPTGVLSNLGRLEDPPPLDEAMDTRETDPRATLEAVHGIWVDALAKGKPRLAAFAIDRAGDLVMDLGERWSTAYPQFEQPLPAGVEAVPFPRLPQACLVAKAYYQRAFGLAGLDPKEHRLPGRIAHDLGWAAERCGDHATAQSWYEIALSHRVTAGEANGVRFTANNLGRIIPGPKRRRLDLYQLAVTAARIAEDPQGERKAQTNIARLWFYSADSKWLLRGVIRDDYSDEYAEGPLRGEVRQRFLTALGAALAAGRRAGESSEIVCEGLSIDDDCTRWGTGRPDELFPEGWVAPTH